LQEEVRKLHSKLRMKDLIIREIKQHAETYMVGNDGKMTARTTKL